jgi:hypothetical protein
MYLTEVIAQKKLFDKKISEVKRLLKIKPTEELAQELMDLLEMRQAKKININSANEQSKINLGGTDITITVAIMLRDTIKEKIEILTELINDPESSLDKLKLLEQRDRHFSEYTLINMGIQRNDLNVTVG